MDETKSLAIVFFTLLITEIVLWVAKIAGSLGHLRSFDFLVGVFSIALLTSGATVASRSSGFARFIYIFFSVVAAGLALYLFAQASGFIAIK